MEQGEISSCVRRRGRAKRWAIQFKQAPNFPFEAKVKDLGSDCVEKKKCAPKHLEIMGNYLSARK